MRIALAMVPICGRGENSVWSIDSDVAGLVFCSARHGARVESVRRDEELLLRKDLGES